MNTWSSTVAAICIALTTLAVVPRAVAQSGTRKVAIVEFRASRSTVEFARKLTDDLADELYVRGENNVAIAAAALDRLMLIHGCTQPDAHCFSLLARELNADVVISGTLTETPTGVNSTHVGDLYRFDARRGFSSKRFSLDRRDTREESMRFLTNLCADYALEFQSDAGASSGYGAGTPSYGGGSSTGYNSGTRSSGSSSQYGSASSGSSTSGSGALVLDDNDVAPIVVDGASGGSDSAYDEATTVSAPMDDRPGDRPSSKSSSKKGKSASKKSRQ